MLSQITKGWFCMPPCSNPTKRTYLVWTKEIKWEHIGQAFWIKCISKSSTGLFIAYCWTYLLYGTYLLKRDLRGSGQLYSVMHYMRTWHRACATMRIQKTARRGREGKKDLAALIDRCCPEKAKLGTCCGICNLEYQWKVLFEHQGLWDGLNADIGWCTPCGVPAHIFTPSPFMTVHRQPEFANMMCFEIIHTEQERERDLAMRGY